jgi:hypothetical protein
VDHSKVSAEKLLKLVTKNKNAAFSPQGLLTLDLPAVSSIQLFEAIDKVIDAIKM